MAWEVKVGGVVHNTDDLTLDDMEAIERAAGTAWFLINPYARVRDACALLAFYLAKAGKPDDEARAEVRGLTVKTAAKVFRRIAEDEDDLPDEFVDGLPNRAGGTLTS